MNKCWFLFFCIIFLACNEISKDNKAAQESDSTIVASSQIDSSKEAADVTGGTLGADDVMECDQALNLMFQTSNYHPDSKSSLSDYRIHVSEPGDSALGIKIYHCSNSDSSLAGLLNLDLETGKLTDVSPPLDSPVALIYDSSYLKIIRKKCGPLPPGLY